MKKRGRLGDPHQVAVTDMMLMDWVRPQLPRWAPSSSLNEATPSDSPMQPGGLQSGGQRVAWAGGRPSPVVARSSAVQVRAVGCLSIASGPTSGSRSETHLARALPRPTWQLTHTVLTIADTLDGLSCARFCAKRAQAQAPSPGQRQRAGRDHPLTVRSSRHQQQGHQSAAGKQPPCAWSTPPRHVAR